MFFGHVTDLHFDAVTRYFQVPNADEGFTLVVHEDDTT